SLVLARSLSTKKVSPDKRILRCFECDDLVIKLDQCISDKSAYTQRVAFKDKFTFPKNLMTKDGRSHVQQHHIDAFADSLLEFNGIVQLKRQNILRNCARIYIYRNIDVARFVRAPLCLGTKNEDTPDVFVRLSESCQ